MSRITMKDVADVMGVSVMTVSNAFNRPDQLSADLRANILSRAEKMGYAGPNAAARHLRSGRTHAYGVVFAEQLSYAFSDPYTVQWLAAFCQVMERQRAGVLLLSVPVADSDALTAVQDAAVDGIAGVCCDLPALEQSRRRGLTTVVCSLHGNPGSDSRADEGDYVVIDDFAAGRDLGEHLHRLGHRDIVILVETGTVTRTGLTMTDPDQINRLLESYDDLGLADTWIRIRGILAALDDCHVRVAAANLNSREQGRIAGGLILDRADRPTAVIAVSDVLALGFTDAMSERGLVPGRDVSVAGFDDLAEAEAAGLTTIAQPIADKGRLAAELLLDPDRTPRQIVLPHRLVVRASTQPAPG